MHVFAKLRLTLALGLVSLIWTGSVQAQQDTWRFALGASSVGPNVEVSYRLSDNFRLRGTIGGGLTTRTDVDLSGITYSKRLNLRGGSVMVDWYPTTKGLRFTGGLFFERSRASGDASGTLTIGDNVYNASVTLDVSTTNRAVPFVGVGYEIPLGGRFFLAADVGAIWVNEYTATLTRNSGDVVNLSDLVKEADQAKSALSDVLPYASLNLIYRF